MQIKSVLMDAAQVSRLDIFFKKIIQDEILKAKEKLK